MLILVIILWAVVVVLFGYMATIYGIALKRGQQIVEVEDELRRWCRRLLGRP